MVGQNSIAPRQSPGHGTQNDTAAPSLLSGLALGFVCHVPPHLHCQHEQCRGISHSVFPGPAPGTFSVRETKPETVSPFKCNFVLQERRKARKEMACSFDDSKVCSDMPLKRARLPQQPLLDNERRGTQGT